MAATREQLVADWHDRLAAAQADPVAFSPRGAWLARVRIRLYRLLISIYGDGQWRRGDEFSKDDLGHDAGSNPSEFAQSSPPLLAGKPARTSGKIAAVLKSVASAQDAPRTCGPLAGGITADSWIVVACESANISPTRCAMLLQSSGIVTRIANQGDDVLVHVPAADRKQALMLIDKHAAGLRRRARHPEARRWRGAQWVLLGLTCAPPAGFVAMIAWLSYSGGALDGRALAWMFFAGCAASIMAGATAQALAQTPLSGCVGRHAGKGIPDGFAAEGTRGAAPLCLWIGLAPLFGVVAMFAARAYGHVSASSSSAPAPVLAAAGTFGLLSLVPFWREVARGAVCCWQALAVSFAQLKAPDGGPAASQLPLAKLAQRTSAQEKSRSPKAPAKT